jgi:hypothetical protein
MACCFGNGSVSASVWSEAVTAVVEGRFKDRLQYLEDRLLNRPVGHVWNAGTRHAAPTFS